jgi:hypothetical protein
MMKRNKKLDKVYLSFIEDLMLFIKETKQLSKENTEKIKNNESKLNQILKTPNLHLKTSGNRKSISIVGEDDYKKGFFGPIKFSEDPTPLMDASTDMRRIRKLAHNANFLYCFALFENYASEVVRTTFKYGGQSKDSPKERYVQKFQEFAEKEGEKGNHRYTRMYRNNPEMLDNYDKLSGKMNLWTYMLGIEKKGNYKKHIFRYNEARERRNLLTHRGLFRDQKYIKSFIEIHSKPDNGKTAEKFLEDTYEKFSIKRDDKKIEMTVLPGYFEEVFEMLLVMSSLLYMYSFKPSKQEIDGNSLLPENLLHDLMCFAVEIDNSNALFSLVTIILEYKQNCAQNEWENVPGLDKINLIIMLVYRLDELIFLDSILNKKNKKNKKTKETLDLSKKAISNQKEMINYFRKEIAPTISSELKLMWKLLESYVVGDIDGLIKNSKKAKIKFEDTEIWFIYKKYKKNEKFQEYCDSIKPKEGSHTVNVVASSK